MPTDRSPCRRIAGKCCCASGATRAGRSLNSRRDTNPAASASYFTNERAGAATSIESAVRSVKEIEELTGFKFFRNLDPAVADAVKSQKNLADW